jgi:hypothetical protein
MFNRLSLKAASRFAELPKAFAWQFFLTLDDGVDLGREHKQLWTLGSYGSAFHQGDGLFINL